MFSGDLLRRYFRYFVLIVSIIVVVMGFFWLNFLYTRHQRELTSIEESTAIYLQEEARNQARLLEQWGEEIKANQLIALEDLLVQQASLLKAGVYDIFTAHGAQGENRADLERLISNLSLSGDLKIQLVVGELSLGVPLEIGEDLAEGNNYLEDKIVNYGHVTSPDYYFWIQANPQEYVNQKIEGSFRDFALWDDDIYLKDSRGKLILPIGGYHAEEGFYFEEFNDYTGYSYGYFISKSALSQAIDNRKDLFESFLRSHVVEIVGFLIIFIVTTFVIYRRGLQLIEGYYTRLNDEILDAFRNELSLSQSPNFQHFALGDSFDSIIRESRLRSQDYEEKIDKLSKELKKNKLDRLLLERKIMRLSELPFTKEILHNYSLENFSPRDLIELIHRKIDPDMSIEILGSKEIIRSDLGLFSGLVEEIFKLSRDENRNYSIRIVRDGGQMLIYFTLKGMDGIEDDKMQELKNRAKLLDGVFLRHQLEADTLHLVLSLNDIRNEEV